MRAIALRLGVIGAIAGGAFLFRDFLPSNAGNLAVGDCFDPPTGGETVEDVQHHPCTEAHGGEVIFVGDFNTGSDTYPTDAEFDAFFESQCLPAFAAYTGIDYFSAEAENLGMPGYTPTEEGWADGDRKVICYVVNIDGSTSTTSLRKAQ